MKYILLQQLLFLHFQIISSSSYIPVYATIFILFHDRVNRRYIFHIYQASMTNMIYTGDRKYGYFKNRKSNGTLGPCIAYDSDEFYSWPT